MHRNNGPKAYKCNFVLRIIAMGRKQFNRCVTFDAGFLPSKRRSLSRLTLHWVCCCVCAQNVAMQVPWPPRERGFDSRRQSHVLSVAGANSQCRWGGAVTVTWRVRTPAHAVITPCQRRLRCVIGLCARACRRRLIGACAHGARTRGRLHSYGGQRRH